MKLHLQSVITLLLRHEYCIYESVTFFGIIATPLVDDYIDKEILLHVTQLQEAANDEHE